MNNMGIVGKVIVIAALIFVQSLQAQDPARVDSLHHKVIFENDQVRVVRVTYASHEKGAIHNHPNGVAVFLTDATLRFTLPDGKTLDRTAKAGEAVWSPATRHIVENAGEKKIDLIHVELKPTTKPE